jgi:hypothetical protein
MMMEKTPLIIPILFLAILILLFFLCLKHMLLKSKETPLEKEYRRARMKKNYGKRTQ